MFKPQGVPYAYYDEETCRVREPWLPGGRRAWEIGGVRIDPDGSVHRLHAFIDLRALDLPLLLPDSHAQLRYELEMGIRDITDSSQDDSWYKLLPADVQESLDVGGFHERHPQRGGAPVAHVVGPIDAAHMFRQWMTPWRGSLPVLSGMVIGFDATNMKELLYRTGGDPDESAWDYHLECVETYAAGYLGWSRPYKTKDLMAALGIELTPAEQAELHTAPADAALARRIREVVIAARMENPL